MPQHYISSYDVKTILFERQLLDVPSHPVLNSTMSPQIVLISVDTNDEPGATGDLALLLFRIWHPFGKKLMTTTEIQPTHARSHESVQGFFIGVL